MPYTRSLSVQSKLIAAFVLLTLVTIGVVSWIGYVSVIGGLVGRRKFIYDLWGHREACPDVHPGDASRLRARAGSGPLFEGSPRLARETGYSLEVHRKALQSARAALHRG